MVRHATFSQRPIALADVTHRELHGVPVTDGI